MSRLYHHIPLLSSQHDSIPNPLRILLIVALVFALLVGLVARAVVAVAVLIFGSR